MGNLRTVIEKIRSKRINVTIKENLLVEIDKTAAEQGMTRSALLAEAARRFIRSRNKLPP